MEFDSVAAPIEITMIQYFWEGLKPSIKAKIDQYSCELDSFKKLIEKAVKAKAKATIQPGSYTCETNHRCFRGSCPAYTTKIKDLKPKDPKSRP